MKQIFVLVLIAMIGFFPLALAADQETQDVSVVVGQAVPGLDVIPSNYDYGTVIQGQCSDENPNGTIYLNNTGNVNITVTTIATYIFENIDYRIGSGAWIDVNSFSIGVATSINQTVNTQICIPSVTTPTGYSGAVTFEYISTP